MRLSPLVSMALNDIEISGLLSAIAKDINR